MNRVKQMNKKIKLIFLSCLILLTALLAVSCSGDSSPYGDHNDDGFTVTVKYDSNGGVFTTNTKVITDSYDLSEYKTNSEGKKEITLIAPNDPLRGQTQAYSATNPGHILVGWYTERTENTDQEGNVTYTYGGFWNFGDKLSVDAEGDYDAAEPVITLYAAWLPDSEFKYEFYQANPDGSFTLAGEKNVNPFSSTQIKLPATDVKTGRVNDANDFPALSGLTYDTVYTDEGLTDKISSEVFSHTGSVNTQNATYVNPVQKLYFTVREGVEYEIDSVDKFKSAPKDAKLILTADLDFTDDIWPSVLLGGEFKGHLIGNGHTIKNITVTQKSTSTRRFGLFGSIASGASVENVRFENISANIESARASIFLGILTSEISDGASVSGVTLKDCKMFVSSNFSFSDVKFGLSAANGDTSGITLENVSAELKNFLESSSTKDYIFNYDTDGSGKFTLSQGSSQD